MQRLTRGKAIRAKCLDCCCGDSKEVRLCTIKDCSLYPYRMGREEKSDTSNLTSNLNTTLNENDP